MVIRKVKKLWQGKYVSVRDTDLQKAVEKGGLKIVHDGDAMVFTPEDCLVVLRNNAKKSAKVYQSKFKGSYSLVDLLWKPLVHDERQQALI